MAKVQKPAELAAMEDSDGNAENVLISPKVGGQWTTLVSIFYPSAILCTSIGSSSRQSTALKHLRRDFSARTIRRGRHSGSRRPRARGGAGRGGRGLVRLHWKPIDIVQ